MANLHRRVRDLRRGPLTQRRARPVVGQRISPRRLAHRPRVSSALSHISNAEDDRGGTPTDAAHETRPAATNIDTGTGSPSAVRPPRHSDQRPEASWLGPQTVPRRPGDPPSPERPPPVIDPSIWGPPGIAIPAYPFPGNPNLHRRPPPRPPATRWGAAAHHHPFAQLQALPPHERGHWAFDTATWPAATRAAFAKALGASATYIDRFWTRRESEEGQKPLVLQRRDSEFRAFTTRVLSGPLWRRLVAHSAGWLETVRAVWVDGNDVQVTLMLPRRVQKE